MVGRTIALMKRLAVWLILLLAFCGLANSAYLAQSESDNTPRICNFTDLDGCDKVAKSPYSHMLGIPLPTYGLIFYGALFVLAAIEIVFSNLPARRAIQVLAALGVIASAYFIFVQVVLIDALCAYCIASAVIAFLIFIAAYFVESLTRSVIILPSPQMRTSLTLPPPSV